jgi:predicted ATPase
MLLERLSATNFKTFEQLDIPLQKFNVLVGANASGKSNFVSIFRFLQQAANFGIDNAISLQGGGEYLTNLNASPSLPLTITAVIVPSPSDRLEFPLHVRAERGYRTFVLDIHKSTYELSLGFSGRGRKLKTVEESITHECSLLRRRPAEVEADGASSDSGTITIRRDGKGRIHVEASFGPETAVSPQDIATYLSDRALLPLDTLMIQFPFPFFLRFNFDGTRIYDFDPKQPKKATPITGKAELEEDASNLAIVLQGIVENKAEKSKFANLMRNLLPFVDDIKIQKFSDKSLLFSLREKYCHDQYLPASLISDGTVNVTAMVVALFFEQYPFLILEEPERNIHPHLIAAVAEMIQEAATQKQIIVTTHSPELLRQVDISNLLLVTRSEAGASSVSRVNDNSVLRAFLEHDIGVDELFVQNFLTVSGDD